jgi:hypothetical protein
MPLQKSSWSVTWGYTLGPGAIVTFMVSSETENEMWLAMMDALVGAKADLEPAKIAFETTRGEFATRFTAAVDALEPDRVVSLFSRARLFNARGRAPCGSPRQRAPVRRAAGFRGGQRRH